MPNKNRMKKTSYYGHEHDDRVPHPSEITRRVSFKNYGPNKGPNSNKHRSHRQRNKFEKMQEALAIGDEDVDMMISSSFQNRGQNRYNGSHQIRGLRWRGRVNMRREPNQLRKLGESPYHFYRITVPEGHKYEKEYILALLQSYVKPLTFTALGYKKQNDSICFFIDDHKAAEQIMQADKKITTSDDWRLALLVRPVIPSIDVDNGMKALMKLAMSNRYNMTTKALDLSGFHNDPVIVKENAFCPLNRTNVMQAAIQIIGESIPDLVALKVSDNKLVTVDGLKKLKDSTPNLKVLHIGNNKIRFLNHFDIMQGLPVEEIELDGNPLCDKFKDKDNYIREVQKRFPKVIKLDGADVPKAITFNVEEEIALPKSQGSFLCAPAAADVIKPFLQQYYQLYDSETRAPLMDAYHENAQFSLSCSVFNGQNSSMAPYVEDSRNLMVVQNNEKRKRLLRRGKANIIAYLTTLPRTEHDPTSLVVDCSIFTPTIMMMSVSGVFREVEQKKPLRSFQRSFVIVPVGAGFCIINEVLHVSPATSDQVKMAFKPPQPVVPAVPVAVPPVAVAGPSTPAVLDIATKQQMVSTLALQSGMNLSFSEKCLSENNWDFDRAVFIFSELQKQGKIPPEAFIK
ncbi:nuclear RNA export factor 1-like [Macrosteles quadrilineatus]|uniref:nuclear RNA export factor 1-like n=1 Tax=Macrosteles quadrilineatus TaxID=74068 RepID=UPI0023E09349|nr:nuclear RNA export factor 1-like [Macrosteles quadrilineatus]XP_054261978.1 nuclear RNA export factor 1-like [Macrosteles quadrilineatus]